MQQQKTLSYQVASESIPCGLRDLLLTELNKWHFGYYDEFALSSGDFYQHRTACTILILLLYLELNPHNRWEGWQALTYKQLRRLFRGDKCVIKPIRGGVFFDCDYGYQKGSYSRSAKLDDETIAIVDRVLRKYCENPSAPELLDRYGKPLTPKHIARTSYGKSKPLSITNLPLYTRTHIEAVTVALRHLEQWLKFGTDKPHPTDDHPRLTEYFEDKREEYKRRKRVNPDEHFKKHLKKARKQLMKILAFAGIVPNNIAMSAAGRLYGPFLQTCLKVVRMVALHGHWNYDFQACHHRIFQHRATRYSIPCPNLDQYLRDKKRFRAELADELGVSVEQVKAVLLAIGYGAGIAPWRFVLADDSRKEKYKPIPSAMQETLGVGSEAFNKAAINEKIHGLKLELTAISDRMLAEAKRVNGLTVI